MHRGRGAEARLEGLGGSASKLMGTIGSLQSEPYHHVVIFMHDS